MSTTVPGTPLPTRYTLYYKAGGEPGGFSIKHFDLKGDLTSAIQRGRQHCTIMKQKGFHINFLSVRPFLTDLDEEEKVIGKDS